MSAALAVPSWRADEGHTGKCSSQSRRSEVRRRRSEVRRRRSEVRRPPLASACRFEL